MQTIIRGSTLTTLLSVTAAVVGLSHCSPGGDDKGGSKIDLGGGSGGADSGSGSGMAAAGGGFSLQGNGGQRPSGGPIDGGCASTTEEGVQIPANLMFVVDRSGSMNCCPPPVTGSARCETFPVKEGCTDSKWDITRDALIGAIDNLRSLGNISVGVTMFPTDNLCGFPTQPDVDIAALDDAHFTSVQTFLQGVKPGGKTPLAGATLETYGYLQDTFQDRLRTENTFVVVVTDGADTCAPSEMSRLVDELAGQASSINIRTFVIGAPGSEPARLQLSKLAAMGGTSRTATCDYGQNGVPDAGSGAGGTGSGGASGAGGTGGSATDASTPPGDAGMGDAATPDGGTDAMVSSGGAGGTGGSGGAGGASAPPPGDFCHFDMTTATDFAAELASALDAITGSKELSCEFDVPTNPDGREADPDKVNVTLTAGSGTSTPILQDTSAACDGGADGWQYNADQTKILLCGPTCDQVQADRGAQVQVVLGCPTDKFIR